MTITDVRIRKIASEGKMKAIVSVTFDNEFVVHDIKVIEVLGKVSILLFPKCLAVSLLKDVTKRTKFL